MQNKKLLIALFLVFLLQAALILGLWHQRPLLDEGRYLTTGWMITQGRVPFADTFSPKPPGVEFVFAGLFSLLPPALFTARAFMALLAVLQAALIFILAKKMFGEKAALIAALFYPLWSLGFGAYWAIIAPFLALLSTAVLLFSYRFLFQGQRAKDLLLAGLFLGAAITFKQTMLPFAVAAFAAILAINYFKNRALLSPKQFLPFAAGFLAVPFLLLIYLAANNALAAFLEAMLFSLAQSTYFSIVIDARALIAAAAFSPIAIALLALVSNKLGAGEKKWEIALLTAFFIFSFANALPFRACCMHLLPALPAASILFGFVAWKGMERAKGGACPKPFLAFSIALLLLSLVAAAFFSSFLSSPSYSFSSAEQVALFVKQNSSPSDTILVIPASAEIYFLSQRMPAARQFIFFDPCPASCQQPVIRDLEESSPALIVYFTPGESPESGMQLIDGFVQENFTLIETIELEPKLYTFNTHAFIFRRKPA